MVEMTALVSPQDLLNVQALGFTQLQPLFQHPLERHYRGILSRGDYRLVIFRRATDERELRALRKTIQSQERAGKVALLQLMGHYEFQSTTEYVDVCMVFSSIRSSVAELLRTKATENQPFEPNFLEFQVDRLVSVLAAMQQTDLAHRNLTLSSLYVTNTGLKLGEMGAPAKEVMEQLTGCRDLYLSPLKRTMERSGQWLIPNPFKSDVWSLGVSILAMMLLRLPRLENLETLREDVRAELSRAKGPERIKRIVGKMLEYEERTRLDFVGLERDLAKDRRPFQPLEPSSAPSQSDIDRLSVTIPRKPVRQSSPPSHHKETIPPPNEEVRCMFCSTLNIIEPTDPSSFERPVRLFCNLESHVFCSRRCFSLYAQACTNDWKNSLSNIKCKHCSTPIDSELTIEAIGGTAQYEKLRIQPLAVTCCYCRTQPGSIEMPCGHKYCNACLRMMNECKTETVECSVCHYEFSKKDIAKHVKSWWLF
jgi:serine/threonine protein kinase